MPPAHPDMRHKTVLCALLALFFGAAGVVHITSPDVFLPIVPQWVPAPRTTVFFTGLCEIAGAVALFIPRLARLAGAMLALYSVCVFPANIKHAVEGIALMGSVQGWSYHIPRLAMQPVIVWLCLYATGITHWPFSRRPNAQNQSNQGER